MTQRCEQETILSRMADEDRWQVYTCDRVVKARVLKLAERTGLAVRKVDDVGIVVLVPKEWVRIRAPRAVSEATRERARAMGRERAMARKRIQ